MASIKDAFDETLQDKHAVLKCIIFTIPLFYCCDSFLSKGSHFILAGIVTAVLLFGFILKCTENVRKGANCVLPSFNIFSLLVNSIKGLIILSPVIILSYFAGAFIVGFLEKIFSGQILTTFISIIIAICSSFILTSYLLYAKDFRIKDAFNLSLISTFCIDIILSVIIMIIKLLIVDIIIVLPVTYLIWLFFGIPHPIALFYWCLIAVFNIAMIGHYLAQIDYEIISRKEDN